MKYDDASWHYGGDFPKHLNNEAGATHIGMFVSWCILNDLGGAIHVEEFPEQLLKLKNRELTSGQWFIHSCDEKFTDEDLSKLGNEFAEFYYAADDAPYLEMYELTLGQSGFEHLYEVPDTWESYDKLASILKEEFTQWFSNHK